MNAPEHRFPCLSPMTNPRRVEEKTPPVTVHEDAGGSGRQRACPFEQAQIQRCAEKARRKQNYANGGTRGLQAGDLALYLALALNLALAVALSLPLFLASSLALAVDFSFFFSFSLFLTLALARSGQVLCRKHSCTCGDREQKQPGEERRRKRRGR